MVRPPFSFRFPGCSLGTGGRADTRRAGARRSHRSLAAGRFAARPTVTPAL